jgi:hypothetical protein
MVDPESRIPVCKPRLVGLMPDSWIITITAGAGPRDVNALDEALQSDMTCNEGFAIHRSCRLTCSSLLTFGGLVAMVGSSSGDCGAVKAQGSLSWLQ